MRTYKNLTELRKGDTLYFVDGGNPTQNYVQLRDCLIDSITAAKDYIICHCVYAIEYAKGSVYKYKMDAIFMNTELLSKKGAEGSCGNGAQYIDISGNVFVSKECAVDEMQERLRTTRLYNIGKHAELLFKYLKK